MKYQVGEKVCISIDAMISEEVNMDMDYVEIVTEHDDDATIYMLCNEFGEICCLNGEECVIDHVVNGTTNIYDLVNLNGEYNTHFMMSENDLDIAVFR